MVGAKNESAHHAKTFSRKIKFDRSDVILKGAFGIVFLGLFNNEIVRVKRIAVHRVKLRQNMDLQINLDHENVVKLFTVEDDEDFWYI